MSTTGNANIGGQNNAGPQQSSQALANLQRIIAQSHDSFSADQPTHKQIWNIEDAAMDDLREGARLVHAALVEELIKYCIALLVEVSKLMRLLREPLHMTQHDGDDDLKGNICMMVLQRHTLEKLRQDMAGPE